MLGKDYKYILNENKKPIPCSDIMQWSKWFEDIKNRVVKQEDIGKFLVSTVFVGIDHNFLEGPPALFETIVFQKDRRIECMRYHTYEEAVEGHRKMAEKVKKGEV